ncbi:hypothetical protein [Clostridium kluyveri]|nr:hypothetical protein [Clostridium kluyveri]UZQ50319.1 hypothetical protein OP486_20675 [Clostridium kluyveri]
MAECICILGMNKKLKVLSSVIYGLVLTSGLSLTSVQAAPISTKLDGGASTNAVIPGQTYSYYTTISGDAKSEFLT